MDAVVTPQPAALEQVASDEPYLSVVFPAYNEQARLPATLATTERFLSAAGLSHEILVVDDGSTDDTAAVVRAASARNPRIRLIVNPHRGKGYAVRTGALAARGQVVLFCDADLSAPVEEMARFPTLLDAQHQIVIASREGQGARRIGEPLYRHIMGRVFNFGVRLIAVPGIQDTQAGFKAFTRAAAKDLFSRQTIDGFGFDVELLYLARKLGYGIREAQVRWEHKGLSRVDPIRDTVRMVRDLLRVRWNDLRGRYDERSARDA